MPDRSHAIRRILVGGVLILSMVAVLFFWHYSNSDTSSQIRPEPSLGDRRPAAVLTTTPPRLLPISLSRNPLSAADKREELLSAMNQARERRTLKATKPQNRNRSMLAPATADFATAAMPTVLNLANKTDSDTDWDREQIDLLNQLLGECYDIANVQDPGLSGTIGLEFTLRGEPDVGGLIEEIEFIAEHSSITNPQMRECMQESLYALELDPPATGVEVTRMITMRFSDSEE